MQEPFEERISRRRLLELALATGVGMTSVLPGRAEASRVHAGHGIVFPWLFPSDPASFESLKQHARVITHVSPAWFSIDADLSVTGHPNQTVIQFARKHGVALHPLIRTRGFDPAVAHSILSSPQRRSQAAELITALVTDSGFDGINLDFEGPFGADRDRYSDFVTRLAEKLHRAGKQVTVDVTPQLKPPQDLPRTSWAAPFDYAALGTACDAVMLMCYSFSDARPGSLSPLWWVREATKRALRAIPAHKLVVGQSFYGRHWVVAGDQVSHTDLKQADALALLGASGARLERPVRDATPRFTWTDSAGQHIVHYEDQRSLRTKLAAMRSYGVAGFAFWRLGQEEPSQWKAIEQEPGAGHAT